jgi:hypothetical protein
MKKPTPLANALLPPSPNLRKALVSTMYRPIAGSYPPSIHLPAPSCSMLQEDFPERRPLTHPNSNPGPVDPHDLSLWNPGSANSVPPRPRDSEFERFILDEMGRQGIVEPNSYPAITMRIRLDANRAKSCLHAWLRAEAVDIHKQFYSKPLSKIIHFRNHVAILRSNSNFAMIDITASLNALFSLDTHVPNSDHDAIRAYNDIMVTLSELLLPMENLIDRLDIIITRSQSKYSALHSDKEGIVPVVPVVPSDGEEGEEDADEDEEGIRAKAENTAEVGLEPPGTDHLSPIPGFLGVIEIMD